jgi:hypothetical protein
MGETVMFRGMLERVDPVHANELLALLVAYHEGRVAEIRHRRVIHFLFVLPAASRQTGRMSEKGSHH